MLGVLGVLLVLALLATPARSACPPHSLALYTLQLNTSWTEEDFPRQARSQNTVLCDNTRE